MHQIYGEEFLRTVLKGNTLFRKEEVIYGALIFFLRHWKKEYLIHILNEDFQLLKLLCLNFSEKTEDTSEAENKNLSIWIILQIGEMLERRVMSVDVKGRLWQ